MKLISIFGHFLTVNNRRYGRCYVKAIIPLCTFLEFYTHLGANSAKSFQSTFCKCSKALNIMFLKTSYFWCCECCEIFWTASKVFHKKCVSGESKQRFKLRGENISIQEKQAMPYQLFFVWRILTRSVLSGDKAHTRDVLSVFW